MTDFRVETRNGSVVVGAPVIGGTDTRVFFQDGNTIGQDAGFTYNKTTDTLVSGTLAATQYVYAFSDDLGEYIRMDADDNYGYLNTNKSMVISGGTGASDIIFTHPIAMADLVSSGTSPRTAWVNLIASNSLASSPGFSIVSLESQKNASAWLSYNQLFINQAATYGIPAHFNIGYPAATDPSQTIASNSANAFGIHSHNSAGWIVDLDSNSYYERIYQHYTGSKPITQYNLNEIYNTTDPNGTGTTTATTFTGDVVQLNNSQNPVFRVRYDGRVTLGNGSGFFPTDDTKYINSQTVTSIGTSASPFDIIKIVDEVDATFAPTVATNSGLGITLYSSTGTRSRLSGSANFNGGVPITATQIATSALGSFNVLGDERTSGTLDAAAGTLFQASHSGYGATDTMLIGGIFDVNTEDAPGAGTPSGSLTTAIAGYFTSGGSGIDITNAISIKAFEPVGFDQGTGAGVPTITNKTAAQIAGTITIDQSNFATSASITNMTVSTSSIRMTGTTTTSIHGIHADAFSKHLDIYNASSAVVTIENQSGTEGTAANRIIVPTGNAYRINPGYSAKFIYDTTQSRWLVVSPIVESGVYTPTLSNIANVDSSTAFECQYMRTGNTVTVSGMITIDPTTISTLTQVNMTLPITSNFGTLQDVGGTGSNGAYAARILADTTNDRAQVYYIATDTGSQDWQFTYTYQII